MPYDQSLGALLHEPAFQNLLLRGVARCCALLDHTVQKRSYPSAMAAPLLAPNLSHKGTEITEKKRYRTHAVFFVPP